MDNNQGEKKAMDRTSLRKQYKDNIYNCISFNRRNTR